MKRLIMFLMMVILVGCSSNKGESTDELTSGEKASLKALEQIKVYEQEVETPSFTGQSLGNKPSAASRAIRSLSSNITLDLSKIDPTMASFQFSSHNNQGSQKQRSYEFIQSESDNGQVAFIAVDHDYNGSGADSAGTGYLWYVNTIETGDSVKLFVKSYLLKNNQYIDYNALSHQLTVKNSDETIDDNISFFALGSENKKCEFSFDFAGFDFTKLDQSDPNSLSDISTDLIVKLSSCSVDIKSYDSTGVAHAFSGNIDGFKQTYSFNFSDSSSDSDLEIIIKDRPMYNSSGDRVGYFTLNLTTGDFSMVDNDKQPL